MKIFPERATDAGDWWATYRTALGACLPRLMVPSAATIELGEDEAAALGDREGQTQIYAMQCACEIATDAHGFRPESYVGPGSRAYVRARSVESR